jgi:beta-lactamase superfamily II metal-dependent hydrolase
MKTIKITIVLLFMTCSLFAQYKLKPWSKGYLDIHHINTASGDATFAIFPDGTTMLFDLGDIKAPLGNPEYFHLKTNEKYSAAQIVAHYIKSVFHGKKDEHIQIDYGIISHFHDDHFGRIEEDSERSSNDKYYLNGITEIDKYIPITTLIDRAYPEYNEPSGLKEYYKGKLSFTNYLNFVASRDSLNRYTEKLNVGSDNQIILKSDNKSYPNFKVINVKSNLKTWSGGSASHVLERDHDYGKLLENKGFNENALSIGIEIVYGDFEYFTAGDITGYDWRDALDMETPIAKVIGQVDAMTLNHHGFHDATNDFFMTTLDPSVIINQSRHTPHFQFTPLQNIMKTRAHLYANNLHEETYKVFSEKLKSRVLGKNGHIVIRVHPGGKKYDMYVLDDDDFDLRIIKNQGPYFSNN